MEREGSHIYYKLISPCASSSHMLLLDFLSALMTLYIFLPMHSVSWWDLPVKRAVLIPGWSFPYSPYVLSYIGKQRQYAWFCFVVLYSSSWKSKLQQSVRDHFQLLPLFLGHILTPLSFQSGRYLSTKRTYYLSFVLFCF